MGRVRRDARKGDRENGSLRHRSAAMEQVTTSSTPPAGDGETPSIEVLRAFTSAKASANNLFDFCAGSRSSLRVSQVWSSPGCPNQPSLSGEVRSHLLNDSRGGWHHTKSDPASAIDDGFAIHENFVLAVAATDRFHLDSEFTTEPRRHTDGM
jgi:hypothetical protein